MLPGSCHTQCTKHRKSFIIKQQAHFNVIKKLLKKIYTDTSAIPPSATSPMIISAPLNVVQQHQLHIDPLIMFSRVLNQMDLLWQGKSELAFYPLKILMMSCTTFKQNIEILITFRIKHKINIYGTRLWRLNSGRIRFRQNY